MTTARERPILFSAPMVRALLDGTKTQTRRVIEPYGNDENFVLVDEGEGVEQWRPYRSQDGESNVTADGMEQEIECPFGAIGDRLWVRETFRKSLGGSGEVFFAADHDEYEVQNKGPWKPSIFMPRTASRITLTITDVRVQRLQEISEEDAFAEGVRAWESYITPPGETELNMHDPRHSFAQMWDSLNAKRAPWVSNPWVWALSFEVQS